jgi:hypothetical protein
MWRLDANAHNFLGDFTDYIVGCAHRAVTEGWLIPEHRIEELIRRTDPDAPPPPEWLCSITPGPAWRETHIQLRKLIREVDTGLTAGNYRPTEEDWRRRRIPMFSGRYAVLEASDTLRSAVADVVNDPPRFRDRILHLADHSSPAFESAHVVDGLLISPLLARDWPNPPRDPSWWERTDRDGTLAAAVYDTDKRFGFAPDKLALRALAAGAKFSDPVQHRRVLEFLRRTNSPAGKSRTEKFLALLSRAGLADTPATGAAAESE